MSNINTGGPAFPCMPPQDTAAGIATNYPFPDSGMTLRQYAAIKLRVPDSGTEWLDEMIVQSLRDEFAAKAMQGRMACDYPWSELGFAPVNGFTPIENEAVLAYRAADAMLKAREA